MSVRDEQGPGGITRGRIAAVVGGLLLLGYLVAVAWTAGGVPAGTTVVGVDIGGLTVQAAQERLQAELGDDAEAAIVVTARDVTADLRPQDISLAFDAAATAEAAAGPVWNPVRLLKHATVGGVEVAPTVTYDEGDITAAVDLVAKGADEPAVEPVIEMSLSPVLTPGTPGEGIDTAAAVDLIVSSYLFVDGPLALPIVELPPTVSDDEAASVLAEFAVPAVAAPVLVRTAGAEDTLDPQVIAEALTFSPADGTLAPQLDLGPVRAALSDLVAVERPGRDASFDVSSGQPVVVPSKSGRGITDEDLRDSILAVLPQEPERVAEVEISTIKPGLTTAEAQDLGITEQLSTFTQLFPYAEYREVNVGQAARYMDGTILRPGDVYSMNETIKERTVANGYTEGTFIGSGGRFQEGLGGGVSIATTATWTAAFFAGLEAVEVNPHSLYISRYQAGLEATVAWGLLDLKFANDTDHGVLITTESGGDFITVTMWGTKKYDRIEDQSSERYDYRPYTTIYDTSSECAPQIGVEGFSIEVDRVFFKDGSEVRRQTFATTYDPTNTVVCGSPEPAPAEEPDAADGDSPD